MVRNIVNVPGIKELATIKHFYRFKYLVNPIIYDKIFKKLRLEQKYENFEQVKILDLYPGPAIQSAIFNNQFKPKQHILLDSRPSFAKFIESQYKDSSLQFIEEDPYDWSSYTKLIDDKKQFVPDTVDQDHLNNKFLIMANLSEKGHEGLLIQWLNCLGYRNWLFRFGRVRMLIWVPTNTALKLLAEPGERARTKCSVLRETFTISKLIATTNNKDLELFNKRDLLHWDPVIFQNEDTLPAKEISMSLLEIEPIKHELDFDTWDYVTKHLMILKSTPLIDAVESLGHGGREYFSEKIGDRSFLERKPLSLDATEFKYLTKIFENWPFKPNIYLDFVDLSQEEKVG